MKDLHLFARNLSYKYIFDKERGSGVTRDEDLYKGIKVVSTFLKKQDHTSWPLNQFIVELLNHVLTFNVFMFDGSTYLQEQGL